MVAENSQYWPEIVRAKQLIEEGNCACRFQSVDIYVLIGKIGNIITARAVYTEAFHDTRYHVEQKNDDWRNNAVLAGGGAC